MVILSADEFLESNVLPQYRNIVSTFRALMRELVPDAQEMMYRGIPAFKRKGIIAVINPTRNGVTFSFAHGAIFDDKYGLLEGLGKVSKVVRLKSIDAKKIEALRYYIKQAIELDSH